MPISESRRRANEKYNAKAYDEIKVRVPKGQKEELQAHAATQGESVNGFIGRAIKETIARDGAEKPTGALQSVPSILVHPPQEAATQAVSAQIKEHIAKTGEDEAAFIERAAESTIKRDNISLEMGINPATGEKMKEDAPNE